MGRPQYAGRDGIVVLVDNGVGDVLADPVLAVIAEPVGGDDLSRTPGGRTPTRNFDCPGWSNTNCLTLAGGVGGYDALIIVQVQ